MPPALLTSGAYSSASIIANAQRCVNLYPESNPQETSAPVPVTHLLAPGLTPVVQFPDATVVRCLYTATDGELYAVCGSSVYWVKDGNQPVKIGTLVIGTNPVRMKDNGINVLIADGSSVGYAIVMASHTIIGIDATNNSGTNGFYYTGADWVDYTDSFLIGNIPGFPTWWATASNSLQFDPLSFGGKAGSPDAIAAVVVLKRYIWNIGLRCSSEVWYDAGNANFPFAILPGPYFEHGAVGKYAIAVSSDSIVWVSRNRQGEALVIQGKDLMITFLQTYAIAQEWQGYPDLEDCVAWSFQLGGHDFVGFRFPISDKTWVVDLNNHQWHERVTLDADGNEHQWRVNCCTMAQGKVLAGDYANGWLYSIDADEHTDAGVPIKRLRSWPHQIQEMNRITHWMFRADMQAGEVLQAPALALRAFYDDPTGGTADGQWVNEDGTPLWIDPASNEVLDMEGPLILLRISKTRGRSWAFARYKSMGKQGEFAGTLTWRRLGSARDMVFELSWTSTQLTSLNGAWVLPQPGAT